MKTLGENIKQKRLARGLSLRDLAKKLGVSLTTVFRWEQGTSFPYLCSCWDLADLFDCTLDELCGR